MQRIEMLPFPAMTQIQISRVEFRNFVRHVCILSIESNPFPAKNQTLRSYRVYISLTKWTSSSLIQIESRVY